MYAKMPLYIPTYYIYWGCLFSLWRDTHRGLIYGPNRGLILLYRGVCGANLVRERELRRFQQNNPAYILICYLHACCVTWGTWRVFCMAGDLALVHLKCRTCLADAVSHFPIQHIRLDAFQSAPDKNSAHHGT